MLLHHHTSHFICHSKQRTTLLNIILTNESAPTAAVHLVLFHQYVDTGTVVVLAQGTKSKDIVWKLWHTETLPGAELHQLMLEFWKGFTEENEHKQEQELSLSSTSMNEALLQWEPTYPAVHKSYSISEKKWNGKNLWSLPSVHFKLHLKWALKICCNCTCKKMSLLMAYANKILMLI